MISERIRQLRERVGFSQSQLAKKLDVTRSSVNAWAMGISAPTTQYVVAMAKLFHVSTDYLLGMESTLQFSMEGYTQEEIRLIFDMIRYFDEQR